MAVEARTGIVCCGAACRGSLGRVCSVDAGQGKERRVVLTQVSRVPLSFVEPGRVWVMCGKSD